MDSLAKEVADILELMEAMLRAQQRQMSDLETKVTLLENAHLNLAEAVAQKESA